MKAKQLGQVSPFLFNGQLIVSLDQRWIEVFGKVPTFLISINKDGKLNFCSLEQVRNRRK